jgi:hypothetical protein
MCFAQIQEGFRTRHEDYRRSLTPLGWDPVFSGVGIPVLAVIVEVVERSWEGPGNVESGPCLIALAEAGGVLMVEV